MFTRNYYKLLSACMNRTYDENKWTFKDITNTDRSIYIYNGSNYRYSMYLFMLIGQDNSGKPNSFGTYNDDVSKYPGSYAYGVCFGDGSASPTLDDYKLSGNQITTFTEVGRAINSGYDEANNRFTISLTFTIKNTGDESVTIREAACFHHTSSSSSTNYVTMLDRTLLATPVTIPSGGTGVVTYDFAYNFPTA